MLTIDKLKEYGADTEDGLKRCANMEAFYLSLINTAVADKKIYDLESALAERDLEKAFEVAHNLKGMYGNLSLTPLCEPITAMTEMLRNKEDADYAPLMEEAMRQYELLVSISE